MKLFQTKIFHFFHRKKEGYQIQIMRGRGDSCAEISPGIIDGGIISSDSEAMSDETEIDEKDLFPSQGDLEQAQLEQPPEGSGLAMFPSVGNREALRSPLGLLDEISNSVASERSSDNESQSSGSQFGGSQYIQQRGENSGV